MSFYRIHHLIEADASKHSSLPHRNFPASVQPDRPFHKFRVYAILDDPGKQRRSADVKILCKLIDDPCGIFSKLCFYNC